MTFRKRTLHKRNDNNEAFKTFNLMFACPMIKTKVPADVSINQ